MSLFLSSLFTSLLAICSGFAFGFLLRKATVSRFDVIVGQFLFKDFTVMEVILTAIVTGSIGIYTLSAFGVIPALILSSTPILFAAIGGSIFGIGMSVAGYCPGTAIAALTDGAKEMVYGFLGMISASLFFNELSPLLMPYLTKQDAFFQQTLATSTNLSPFTIIALLSLAWFSLFAVRYKAQKQTI